MYKVEDVDLNKLTNLTAVVDDVLSRKNFDKRIISILEKNEKLFYIKFGRKDFYNKDDYNKYKILYNLLYKPIDTVIGKQLEKYNISLKVAYQINFHYMKNMGKSNRILEKIQYKILFYEMIDTKEFSKTLKNELYSFYEENQKMFFELIGNIDLCANKNNFITLIDIFPNYKLYIQNYKRFVKSESFEWIPLSDMKMILKEATKEDFESLQELKEFIDILKRKNMKITPNEKFIKTLIDTNYCNIGNIECIKKIKFFNREHYSLILSQYKKDNIDLSVLCDIAMNFGIEYSEVFNKYELNELVKQFETLDNKSINFILESIYYHDPNRYIELITTMILNSKTTDIFNISILENFELINVLKSLSRENTYMLEKIDNYVNKEEGKKIVNTLNTSAELVELLKTNIEYLIENKIKKSDVLCFIRRLDVVNTIDLMELCYYLKKYNLANKNEIDEIEKMIYDNI